MTDEAYFFDTYALIEILRKNPQFQRYVGLGAALTKLNLFELYCALRRDGKSRQSASAAVRIAAGYRVGLVMGDMERAAEMWLSKRKQDLSMTDCVGYVIAKRLGVKFLTGDRQFKDMPNVEYVK